MAALFSLVPGLALIGSGHYALGQRTTAYRLFALQGVGNLLLAAGIVPLIATNASRYVTAPLAVTLISGTAVVSSAWLADAYGAAVPPEARGVAEQHLPHIEGELGHRLVYQPAFDYQSFVVQAVDVRWEGLRLRPSAWFALDDHNVRLRALGSYRYFGPRAAPAPAAPDGSFLELAVAVTHHDYASDGFELMTGEIMTSGRLDLRRYDPELTGMFADLGIGLALQRLQVDAAPLGLGTDHALLLLGRFGFGAYFGGPRAPRGEASLYYDHRHDDFAAGLTGRVVGIPGHIGLGGKAYLSEHVGLMGELQVGAAVVGGLSVLVRQEAAP